jgi:ParB-like chromosome segregation protein Spo0J
MKASSAAKAPQAFATPVVQLLPYSRLNPASYNPRKISPRQLDALKAGIRRHGLVEALIVNKDGTIIGGHQRYRAAKEIAVEDGAEVPDLPCVVLDLPDREAKRLNIALNKVSGEWDDRLLGELLEDIRAEHPIDEEDALLLGYEGLEEINVVLGIGPGEMEDDGNGPRPTNKAPSLSVDFPSKELRDLVKAKIASASGKDEASGLALARLLGVGEEPKVKRVKKKP